MFTAVKQLLVFCLFMIKVCKIVSVTENGKWA